MDYLFICIDGKYKYNDMFENYLESHNIIKKYNLSIEERKEHYNKYKLFCIENNLNPRINLYMIEGMNCRFKIERLSINEIIVCDNYEYCI